MSGKIVNNVFRASGVIAATPGGLDWSTAVVTGSTLTATAGKGYFINTTSNACTVTLPSSAEIGDQIVFADYARTWSTNNLIIDSNGNNFQGDPDTYIVDYSTAGQSLNIVYSDATKGWLPVSDDAVADVPLEPNQALFAYGTTGSKVSISNLVNSLGVVSADVTGVGTARSELSGTKYGGDKGIIAYGITSGDVSLKNLVSNTGVVSADVAGVGTARRRAGSTGYGVGLAIIAYGSAPTAGVAYLSLSNLVNTSGVIAADVTGVGTARNGAMGARYGDGLAIFAYGDSGSNSNISNKVNSSGVVATDTTGVGTASGVRAAAEYGGDKAFYAYGYAGGAISLKNLVSNSGTVAADVTGVGTARYASSAAAYGSDKAIVAYGTTGSVINLSNLVNNSGVVAADTSGVGTAREGIASAEYGS
jgi:hypothetical protein